MELCGGQASEDTVQCPFCSEAADQFGDHFMCCKRFEFYTRHESVVQRLTHFVRSAGLRVDNEVSITGWERPADLFVERWSQGEPPALDVTITRSLLDLVSAFKPHAKRSRRRNGEKPRSMHTCWKDMRCRSTPSRCQPLGMLVVKRAIFWKTWCTSTPAINTSPKPSAIRSYCNRCRWV